MRHNIFSFIMITATLTIASAAELSIKNSNWKSCNKNLCYEITARLVEKSAFLTEKEFAHNVVLNIVEKENTKHVITTITAPRAIINEDATKWILLKGHKINLEGMADYLFDANSIEVKVL